MQVTEISAQGLRREFKVVLPAADLASRLEGELVGMKDKVKINGFRPGKVPLSHLKRLYGRSVMGDVVQNAVNEANRKIVEDNGLRLALEPKIDIASDQAEVERAMAAEGDLAFTVAVETIPVFETGTFEDIALERQVAEVSDEEVEAAISRMAEQNRAYTPKTEEGAAVETGDRVIIDFSGTIAGEAFEGGKGEDVEVVIGSGSFIPGFEDKLVGARVGEERTIALKFPDNYLSDALAGRDAAFEVKIKAIAVPDAFSIDDEFAKTLGLDSLDAMRDVLRNKMREDLDRASRDRLKRVLLDALDKKYDFELPEGLVTQEFDNIWRQVAEEQKRTGRGFGDENTTEAEARAEYRRIAERRVRLGLVLAEVGDKAGVKVDDNEVGRALVELVRQYPGQEQKVWEHYRKNPQALAEIKAPLFEDKVVDHIVSLARVTERVVSREELFKSQDDDENAGPASPRHQLAEGEGAGSEVGSEPVGEGASHPAEPA